MNTALSFAAMTAICAVTSTTAVAQSLNQADLEKCAGQPTADLKLACYEALTLSGRRPAPMPSFDVADVEAVPRSVVPGPDDPSKTEVSPTTAVASSTAIETVASQESVHDDQAAEPVSAQANSAVADIAESAKSQTQPDGKSSATATVVEVTSGRFDVLYFHFDNGQIWRQVQARRFRFPKNRAFDVTVTTGLMGDHQLRVEGDGPMTRIRRIK